jgi:hypothetical protein
MKRKQEVLQMNHPYRKLSINYKLVITNIFGECLQPFSSESLPLEL